MNQNDGDSGLHCREKPVKRPEVNTSAFVTNTILWGNESSGGKEIWVSEASLSIEYSDVDGGMGSVRVSPDGTLEWGLGMIEDDPLFVLPDKNDYRLLWGSPCIDTGHPDSLDADGTRRDMGYRYFDQSNELTIYLTPDTIFVSPDDVLGVTCTVINRWQQPRDFWFLSNVMIPGGRVFPMLGPSKYSIPGERIFQGHVDHVVPAIAPQGRYRYRAQLGMPKAEVFGQDRFSFWVRE